MSRLRLLIMLSLCGGSMCTMNEVPYAADTKFMISRSVVQNLDLVKAGQDKRERNVRSTDIEEATKAANLCQLSFDAAANIRDDLFFMKGARAWRITKSLGLLPDENGFTISQFWTGFPDVRIDAAFEDPSDRKIIFISGHHYWTFVADVQTRMVSSKRSTCDFGVCPEEEIRAAVVWGANEKVYLFGKSKFWRLGDALKVEIGYPKNISDLKNVPQNLDAALKGFDGGTYFLKGSRYWELDNDIIGSSSDTAYIGSKWFGCNESMYEKETTTISSPGNGVKGMKVQGLPFNVFFTCAGSLFVAILCYAR